jgi:lysozyme family protein
MEYTFDEAFVLTMMFEVGPAFNPDDAACKAGLINTRSNRIKCGYVNDKDDPGGETKFGVAKTANPTVDIKNLTLEQAKAIYKKKYWFGPDCDELPSPMCAAYFDAVTNHGQSRAVKFLQAALGVPRDGKMTASLIKKLRASDVVAITKKSIDIRDEFYHSLVKTKPPLGKFLKGWLARTRIIRTHLFK